MAIDDNFIDQVSRGFIPPLSKALGEQPLSVITERLYTLPDESVQWIGEVYFVSQLLSFGPPHKAHMQFGVSDFRFVFIEPGGFGASLTFSFWFDVDFEGQTWQRGTIGKKEYAALHMQPPQLKKELLSREMLLTNTAVRTNEKQDKILEIRLSNLKWRNPQTQKFEGGKADSLFQEMMSYYDRRRQVTLRTLMLTMTDPGALEAEMFAAGPAEGQAIQVTEAAPPPQAAKPAEGQAISVAAPAPKPKAAPKPAKQPTSTPAMLTCPSCGRALHAGAKFCGGCGVRFGEQASTPVVQPKKSIAKATAQPEPKPPAPKVAPEPSASKKGTVASASPLEVCPSCGKALRPSVMFCGHCGAKLEKKSEQPAEAQREGKVTVCASCGKPLEVGWKACPYCGKVITE